MKKTFILLRILLVIAFSAMPINVSDNVFRAYAQSTKANESIELENKLKLNPISMDKRVEALENVFNKYNSPLAPLSASYVQIADKNGVDWKLLPAIAGLESSFGQFLMPESYNGYGWGGGYIYFDSWEEGIDTITRALKKNYYGRGATTVWEIGPIYAESPTWAVRVNGFMEQIEAEYRKLQREELALTI